MWKTTKFSHVPITFLTFNTEGCVADMPTMILSKPLRATAGVGNSRYTRFQIGLLDTSPLSLFFHNANDSFRGVKLRWYHCLTLEKTLLGHTIHLVKRLT